MGFLGGSVVKNPPANAGDMGSIPGSGRSLGEGNGQHVPMEGNGQKLFWQTPIGIYTLDKNTQEEVPIHAVGVREEKIAPEQMPLWT